MGTPAGPGELKRRLGVFDAVVIGMGSMIGAGIFAAPAPAARAAGSGLLLSLALAAAVAYCNATSTARLAARHPESGGAFVCGRERLGAFWGHLAGWGFVVGKTASCAAMALTVGAYVWPGRAHAVAVAVVVLAKLMRQRRVVCANFLISDAQLVVEQQDLFAASQIVHLKPLIGREVYRRFLTANPFVRQFYPNFNDADPGALGFRSVAILRGTKRLTEAVLAVPSRIVEVACRLSYRTYLTRQSSRWRSPEQVRMHADCLKLHTQSHRRSILDRFDEAMRRFVT